MAEWQAGTAPNDATDFLQLNIRKLAGGMQVEWSAVPDLSYQLETASRLTPSQWQKHGNMRTALYPTESVYDSGSVTSRFYRVKVK
jgi:hypothetical protein